MVWGYSLNSLKGSLYTPVVEVQEEKKVNNNMETVIYKYICIEG